MKIKRKTKTVIKKYDDEIYVFKNGIAKVPGTYFQKKQMLITLKEFNELSKK